MDDMSDPRDVALVAALLVKSIRLSCGGRFGDATRVIGVSEKTLRRWERMESVPERTNLELLAEKAGHSPALIHGVVRQLGQVRLAEAGGFAGSPPSDGQAFADELLAAATRAIQELDGLLTLEPAPEPWEETGQPRPDDRLRADVLWERFTRRDRVQQLRLVRESSAFHTRSFCERLCQESEALAAGSPKEARELASLALFVARKIRGTAPETAGREASTLELARKAREEIGRAGRLSG